MPIAERMELIRLVLQLQREYYDHWGRWPKPDVIAAQVGLIEPPSDTKEPTK